MTTATATRPSKADRADRAAARTAEYDALRAALATFEAEGMEDEAQLLRVAHFAQTYSERNATLIVMQSPVATDVAGYRAWQARGRQVRKGERGIRILAPAGRGEGTEATPATDTAPAAEAKPGRQFFRLTSVFDLAQTDPMEA